MFDGQLSREHYCDRQYNHSIASTKRIGQFSWSERWRCRACLKLTRRKKWFQFFVIWGLATRCHCCTTDEGELRGGVGDIIHIYLSRSDWSLSRTGEMENRKTDHKNRHEYKSHGQCHCSNCLATCESSVVCIYCCHFDDTLFCACSVSLLQISPVLRSEVSNVALILKLVQKLAASLWWWAGWKQRGSLSVHRTDRRWLSDGGGVKKY